ncbi:MAG: glycoside hydrolase family 2 TIM barrel-domain containing protein [Oscillospiraceae bacterium]
MKYSLKKNNYNTFEIYELGKLKARSYFIPHSNKADAVKADYLTERYDSDKILMLSGNDWQFKYYSKISEMPNSFDTDAEKLDTIKVPSTWQRTGYENPCYLNTRYQFPLNPPKIPTDIPVGVYKKTFNIKDDNKTFLLNFLGVCSCIDLFINGEYVGYSEGSHNTAEFDVSKFLKTGENELVAVVYKWCNGSYLECQDMFRENGIFRDVFIVAEEKSFIYDFSAKTKYNNDGTYDLTIGLEVVNPKATQKAILEIIAPSGEIILTDAITDFNAKKTYKSLNVLEWSAEIPNVYRAFVTFIDGENELSAFRDFIGFKHIEIKGNVFYFNNEKIILKGINHHESHPVTGYTMTLKELERDVRIIKDFNCNTVRLSHYPHDPVFLMLCDVYGLYSIDEMDIECHGVYQSPVYQRFGLISNNLKWKGQFIDRAVRMFDKDKNRPSVVMWSLGNEAGGYKCHDEAYNYLKSVTDTPIHYENAVHTKRFSYDVVGYFYPQISKVISIGEDTIKDKRFTAKPYFLTEYSHSMGMGPGGLNEYVKAFLKYDNLLGGCIWEFCDHSVYDENAKYKYTYGGDHHEKKHDGNFCVDGMFSPDRTPSTGALNMRECYRPIRCSKTAEGKYKFTNTNHFKDTSDMNINWQLLKNGEKLDGGILNVNIKAQSSLEIAIEHSRIDNDNDYVIDFSYETAEKKYIAREQIALSAVEFKIEKQSKIPTYNVEGNNLKAMFNDGEFEFDLKSGQILSYKIGDTELINSAPLLKRQGLTPNMFRAPIDNDMFIKILWNFLGLLVAKPCHISSKLNIQENLSIISKYSIRGLGKLASCLVKITINNDGRLDVSTTLSKSLKLLPYSDITRFGLTLEMPKSFENVEYYGKGERETLSDFAEHGFLGLYSLKVNEMHEKYLRPQESGNRSEVRWFNVTNADGKGIKVVHSGNYLNFNANHYTRYQLAKATHIEDLKDEDTTCVQIDGFVRGTGSQSCGPGPTAENVVNLKKPLTFDFSILPIK